MNLPYNLTPQQLVAIHDFLKPITKAVGFDSDIKTLLSGKDFNARLEAVLNDASLIEKANASYKNALEVMAKTRESKKELNANFKAALAIAQFVKKGRSTVEEVTKKYGQPMAGLVQYHLTTTLR